LLLVLCSMFTFSSLEAQNGCDIAKEWSSRTSYEKEGTLVKHDGKLFEAKWSSKGETPGSDIKGAWALVAFCSGSADCSKATPYSSTQVYQESGLQVVYQNDLYENLWYTKGKDPKKSEVWVYQGP